MSTASLFDAWHLKGGCGEQAGKFACCVSLGKALKGMSQPLSGRQVASQLLSKCRHPIQKTGI